jgi:uncharacterized protein (TIGR02588 family)
MTHATERQSSSPTQQQARISRTEWLAAAVSAAMVVGAIATLLVNAPRDEAAPDLIVHIESIEHVTEAFRVRFTVANTGGATAAQVVVRGHLHNADGDEEPDVVFDFVPGGSQRRGGLMFTHDPRQGDFEVHALGYREP